MQPCESGVEYAEIDTFFGQRGAGYAGATIRGIDLCRSDLSGLDFGGAKFVGVDLTDANLSRCNLRGAIFSNSECGG